jgi:putative heme-binding domain-containing protein
MRRLPLVLLIASFACGASVLWLSLPLQSADPPAAAATPQWIWLNSKPQQNERVFFRKKIEVNGEIKSAKLMAACDDVMTAFLNGQQLFEHSVWQTAAVEDVTKKLQQGQNIIAVRGQNGSSAAAMIFKLDIVMADGTKQTIASDLSWLVTGEDTAGWQMLEFDDSLWSKPHSFGKLGVGPWGPIALDPANAPKPQSTPGQSVTAIDGFKVELLYSVPKEQQGSWVSMTPDPQGRLITSDQYGGLYRVTPGADAETTKVEKLSVAIGEAHGLLYAHGCLYVMVNGGAAQGSGLYRVLDTDGDDQFDKVELIKKIQGGGEHGPHAIRLGPDGLLYIIAGNHTRIPDGVDAASPHRNYAEDLLLPRNPDGNGHATGVMAPGGWVVRTDKDFTKWELFCAGFRNQYDIDFNQDGELFSYDADMEWDTGTPWYRPTRVNHCVSAAEFGWRYGTGKWPDYYADSLGAVVDIGLGSPTGINFGTGAKFPAKYQQALFINDWTYGKIYAVHMKPAGASYTATFETFIQGKPLPVTDIVVNHDGALYFTVGGRRTQSGLYRVTYVGDESTALAGPIQDAAAAEARRLRHELESFHGHNDPRAIDVAWPHLNSSDRAIRYAARVAIEHQDPELWQERALSEPRTTAAIYALLALTRAGDKSLQGRIVARLNQLPFKRMTEDQLLAATRVYSLAFIRMGKPDAALAASVAEKVSPLYPAQSEFVNRELCNLLVYLEAPGVVERTMKLLAQAQTQQDQLHYEFVLRNLAGGWTNQERQAYFSWLNLAWQNYRGGSSFKKFIEQIRKDAVAKLSAEEAVALKDVIEGKQNVEVVKLETTRQFLHNWQMDDLEPLLADVESGRSFDKGRAAYQAAQCYKCHRFAGDGGDTGPDITGVGNRFTTQYLLESLIVPSKAVSDQYQNTILQTDDGEVITGRIIEEDDKIVKIRTDPFALELTELPKSKIEARQPSATSEMPQGLINVLTKEEILDLIAYLRSANDPNDKAFQK